MQVRTLKFWFILTLMLAGSVLELCCGAFGVVLPLQLPLIFYITVVCGWRTGAAAAVCGAIVTDLAYGRVFPVSLPALAAAVTATEVIRSRRGFGELPDMPLPAAAAAAAGEAVWFAACLAADGISVASLIRCASQYLFLVTLETGMALCLCFCLSATADVLGIPCMALQRASAPARSRWPQVRTGR